MSVDNGKVSVGNGEVSEWTAKGKCPRVSTGKAEVSAGKEEVSAGKKESWTSKRHRMGYRAARHLQQKRCFF